MVRFLTDKQKNMIKETEIIDIIKNYVGYTDRSRTDQCLHEVNFDLVAKEIVKKLTIPNVSQQSELLLAFFDLADELPMGLSHYDREKIVEEFLANNGC